MVEVSLCYEGINEEECETLVEINMSMNADWYLRIIIEERVPIFPIA